MERWKRRRASAAAAVQARHGKMAGLVRQLEQRTSKLLESLDERASVKISESRTQGHDASSLLGARTGAQRPAPPPRARYAIRDTMRLIACDRPPPPNRRQPDGSDAGPRRGG